MPENSLSAEQREQCRIAGERLLAVAGGQILRFNWGACMDIDPTLEAGVIMLAGSGVELTPMDKPTARTIIQATLPPPPQAWLDRMGLELTGEFRAPQPGEIVACMDTETKYVEHWDRKNTLIAGFGNYWKRWILRKKVTPTIDPRPPKPTQEQLDSETNPEYAGFECSDEYRIPNHGDAYYDEGSGVLVRQGNCGRHGAAFWILRPKKPSHPRPTDEWLKYKGLRIVSEHMTWGEAQDNHPNERVIWNYEKCDESTEWKAPYGPCRGFGRGNVNDHAYLVESV